MAYSDTSLNGAGTGTRTNLLVLYYVEVFNCICTFTYTLALDWSRYRSSSRSGRSSVGLSHEEILRSFHSERQHQRLCLRSRQILASRPWEH